MQIILLFAALLAFVFLLRDEPETDRIWATLVKDPALRKQAKLGARVGPAAIACLFILMAVLCAVWLFYKGVENPNLNGTALASGYLGAMCFVFFGFGSLAFLAALPAVAISAISGAVLSPLMMRMLHRTALPAFFFPLTLAILVCPLVVVPLVQGLYLTLFELQTRNHLWFISSVLLALNFATSWHFSARTVSLSPFNWRGWLRPLRVLH